MRPSCGAAGRIDRGSRTLTTPPALTEAAGLVLRPLTPADADACVAAARESAASVGRWMDWCHAGYTAAEALAWIELTACGNAEGAMLELGVFDAETGLLLGGAGLNQFNRKHSFCNLGYWVRASRQRRGVATRAAAALARHAFERMAFTRVEIVAAQGNDASHAVARRIGAQFECVARNRLVLHGRPVAAAVYSLVP